MKRILNILLLALLFVFGNQFTMQAGHTAPHIEAGETTFGLTADETTSTVQDHSMFYLDWKTMPLDSLCPRYAEVVPLESDYRTHNYHVTLLYPEWKEMTITETRKMQQWADSVNSELHINTRVGIMRGEGYLDVDFVPVISKEGKFYKLLSAKMEIAVEEKNVRDVLRKTSVAERYTHQSKLASGQWVKISITSDGMYRLTREALTEMGFSNPDCVHLYGYGGHRLSETSTPSAEYDDLQEVPLYKADNDTWLFWGNGLVYWNDQTRIFNQYANQACYFLTQESSASSITTEENVSTTGAVIVNWFTEHVLYEKDEFAYYQGGRNLFENTDYAQSNQHTYTLTTPSSAFGSEKLKVVFTAANEDNTTVIPTVNGSSLASLSISGLSDYTYGVSASKTYDVSSLRNGTDWTVTLTSTAGHTAHLDYLDLQYARQINPEGTFVAFQGSSAVTTTFNLSNVNSSYKVMRIGEPGDNGAMMSPTFSDNSATFTVADGSRRYVCFNPAYAFPEPTVIGAVANQNLHALDSLDMVIIIPESGKLLEQANRLANAHTAYDGLRVGVVSAPQVYNEFSSGTPDATAYRRLMKMLYDRADGNTAAMPRYLLLMGDCFYDNRLLTSAMQKYTAEDLLLCFPSENSMSDTRSYVMEDYFGLLDDGEGASLTRDKMDISVGRFPVRTAAQAQIMVDKVIDFISNANAGSWKNVVTMLGDDGDENSHMNYCNDVADNIILNNPELEVKKVMWDAYKRVSSLTSNSYPEVTAKIKKQLKEGALFMNYTGHGAAYVLSHELVWYTKDFQEFKSTKLPVWFTAACDIMPFDGETTNMGVEAVTTEGGGALAFIGTTRTVYATNNWHLNKYFSFYAFTKDSNKKRYSIGDALRLAKCALIGDETTNLENKLQYCILGDPAIVLGEPTNHVYVDSILNADTGESATALKAGMPVRITGNLQDINGNALTDFSGTINLNVYDSRDTIVCQKNDPSLSEAFSFTDYNSMLFTGQGKVTNGKFELYFIVPKDIKYSNGYGRMVFYALSSDLKMEANGYNEDFIVGGSYATTDSIGPEIEMTLNGELDGCTVNSTPYFCARLSDPSGISYFGNGVGHDLLLSVDNNPDFTYVVNDYYVSDVGDFTHGSLSYSIPSLAGGEHTLTLRVWDLLNNTSIKQMGFNVDPTYAPTILQLQAVPAIALTSTNFLLSCDLKETDCDYSIEVFDFTGRRIWLYEATGSSSTGQFSIPWNLRVGAGYGRVCPGIYLYRASIKSGESELVSKTKKLIVNKQ